MACEIFNIATLIAPKKRPTYVRRYVDKPDYGVVPKYLVKFVDALKEKQTKANAGGPKQEGLGTQPNTRRQVY